MLLCYGPETFMDKSTLAHSTAFPPTPPRNDSLTSLRNDVSYAIAEWTDLHCDQPTGATRGGRGPMHANIIAFTN